MRSTGNASQPDIGVGRGAPLALVRDDRRSLLRGTKSGFHRQRSAAVVGFGSGPPILTIIRTSAPTGVSSVCRTAAPASPRSPVLSAPKAPAPRRRHGRASDRAGGQPQARRCRRASGSTDGRRAKCRDRKALATERQRSRPKTTVGIISSPAAKQNRWEHVSAAPFGPGRFGTTGRGSGDLGRGQAGFPVSCLGFEPLDHPQRVQRAENRRTVDKRRRCAHAPLARAASGNPIQPSLLSVKPSHARPHTSPSFPFQLA